MTNIFMKVNKDLFTLGLAPIEILILAQVMEFNTNTGDCFISNQTMAAQFGVSEKTVARAITNLEQRGFVIRDTRNVQKGKERHMRADIVRIEAELAKDKMTLVKPSEEFTKDKMTLAEKSNCPFQKGQNDSIKDKRIYKEKDNKGIDELPSAALQANSSIPTMAPLEEISPSRLLAMGAKYEITEDDLIRIVDTGKLFRIKQ